ncbi:g-patch domain-containing protein [Diaporthe amygdali]|uniref:g-patch domain-containing protein n=1 Tax=Phomopsis amygdali TaxID=1214568 RepID=UPI0022FF3E6E|nr:g-patch domain-containing protein [Diaporthe amygdali]KAJ0121797.1 g-patch domain-containing protein [Diaporthe amygdali]
MGLAGTKNKRKWAKDPNNTNWSRNTDTFGHKILRSQGWAPGQYLGAENASHSEYYGAANATHIRAVLKDDSLGLGAKRNQGDECTGLDALQDLLSRLNGKSDESLGEEKKKREDLKINKYLHRKLGTVTFVYGGLLVGDKVQELADSMKDKKQDAAQVPGVSESEEASGESSEAEKKEKKKGKKRKAEDAEGAQSNSKKDKKSKRRKSEDEDEDSKSKRKEKKDKKRRKEKDASDKDEDSSPDDADEEAADRKKAKKEKKERRRKSKLENEDEDAAGASDSKSKKSKKKRKAADEEPTPQPTQLSTPAASGTSTPSIPTRHLARSRFIAQKRAAVMDQAALNQIFMIKT